MQSSILQTLPGFMYALPLYYHHLKTNHPQLFEVTPHPVFPRQPSSAPDDGNIGKVHQQEELTRQYM